MSSRGMMSSSMVLKALDARQREEGHEHEDARHRVVALGPDEVLVNVAQQANAQQSRQRDEHPAVGHIVDWLEA